MPITLMYHDVIPEGGDKDASGLTVKGAGTYKISESVFEAQVSLAKEISRATGTEIVFTFDDGGKSAVSAVAPLLEKYGVKGLFFIPTAYIGQPGFMTSGDILILWEKGHIIGSHSHLHRPMMNSLPYRDIFNEWKLSCSILQDITGEPPGAASVPGGWYGRAVARAAAEAGISELYTSRPGIAQAIVSGCIVYDRFAVRAAMTLTHFQDLLAGKNLAREKMQMRWRIGQVVKKFYGR